jgi:hypothetical protein
VTVRDGIALASCVRRLGCHQAFSEMKRYRFGADILHSEFKSFVYAYRQQPTLAASSGTLIASEW